MRLKYLIILLLFCFAYFPLQAQQTDVLELIQSRYNKIKSFRGKFIQQSFNVRNSKPRTASGKVSYLRPGKMRWDYDKPKQLLVTDGIMLWLFDPLLENVTVQALRKITQGTPLTFLLGAGDLKNDFTERPVTRELIQNSNDLIIELKPKKKVGSIDFIQLAVNPQTYDFKKIIIVDLQENYRVIGFEDMEYNITLNVEQFKFKITPDMEVINANR